MEKSSAQSDSKGKSTAQSDSNTLPRWTCHICLEEAKTDPVLTGCGHLFCWPCLHSWVRNNMRKPCPVCRAPVTNTIPVYGSTESEPSSSSAPPRPRPIARPAPALLPPVQLNTPPVQLNTAPGLRNEVNVMRITLRRAQLTRRQQEEAAARVHAASDMAQMTGSLASVEEHDHNISRVGRGLEAMSRSEALTLPGSIDCQALDSPKFGYS